MSDAPADPRADLGTPRPGRRRAVGRKRHHRHPGLRRRVEHRRPARAPYDRAVDATRHRVGGRRDGRRTGAASRHLEATDATKGLAARRSTTSFASPVTSVPRASPRKATSNASAVSRSAPRPRGWSRTTTSTCSAPNRDLRCRASTTPDAARRQARPVDGRWGHRGLSSRGLTCAPPRT
jgi:hypothetical protein